METNLVRGGSRGGLWGLKTPGEQCDTTPYEQNPRQKVHGGSSKA